MLHCANGIVYGAFRSDNSARILSNRQAFLAPFATLAFDDNAAEYHARIRFDLEKRGIPIGPNDSMIAAIALANNLTLITNNTREFRRISGLAVEDWEF